MDFYPFIISIKVALISTIITFILGIGFAWIVVHIKRGKGFVDSILTLPLILPPTVVGFFLLMAFGRHSFIGKFLQIWDISIVFSWIGAIVASTVVAFPLMYRTTRGAFEQVDMNIIYAARTLGLSELKIFWSIWLPLSLPGIIAGTVLSFARALGEFGATIMLAGNIPGKTQTMAIAVYTAVQSGDRELAFRWVMILCTLSFVMIILMNFWSVQQSKRILTPDNKKRRYK